MKTLHLFSAFVNAREAADPRRKQKSDTAERRTGQIHDHSWAFTTYSWQCRKLAKIRIIRYRIQMTLMNILVGNGRILEVS